MPRPEYESSASKWKRLVNSRLDFRHYALPILEQLSSGNPAMNDLPEYSVLQQLANLDSLGRIIDNIPGSLISRRVDKKLEVLEAEHHLEVRTFQLMICCILARSKQRTCFAKSHSQRLCITQSSNDNGHKSTCQHHHDLHGFQVTIIEACRFIIAFTQKIRPLQRKDQRHSWVKHFSAYTAISILSIESIRSGIVQYGVRHAISSGRELFEHLAAQNPNLEFPYLANKHIHSFSSKITTLKDGSHSSRTTLPRTNQQSPHPKHPTSLILSPAKRLKTSNPPGTHSTDTTKTSAGSWPLNFDYGAAADYTSLCGQSYPVGHEGGGSAFFTDEGRSTINEPAQYVRK